MDFEKVMMTAGAVQMAFDTTDDITALMSSIGCALDYWAADHGVSAEALEQALIGLLDASKAAHEAMGMPERRDSI